MSLINVTTWSGRKLHLADPETERGVLYGGAYLPTLCGESGVRPGGRWVLSGAVTQFRIDKLEPCKRCEKRRAAVTTDGDQ